MLRQTRGKDTPATPPYPGAPSSQQATSGVTSSSLPYGMPEQTSPQQEISQAEAPLEAKPAYIRTLVGPLVANAVRLVDENKVPPDLAFCALRSCFQKTGGIFFVFPDMSVRTEGLFNTPSCSSSRLTTNRQVPSPHS
jgi:hypothetical protein